jgi:hypothetical protein
LFYAQKDLKRSEAQEAVTELRWPDGSPIFRIVKVANDNQEPRPRPLEARDVLPRRSKLRCYAQDVIDAPDGLPEQDAEEMFDFGAWSVERRFALRTDWRVRKEGQGLGRGPEDTQQDIAVQDLLFNGGGMVLGRGGTGKSTVLRRLKEALEARGEEVHVIAFTHVAAGNIDGGTILHELHSNIRKKQVCLLIDEISMVSRKMWAQLARYRFTGSKLFLFGDPVQFGAIQDQGKGQIDFDHNFFWRLCNGLQLHLNKFRRGGDAGHFSFVGSLYPPHSPSLQDALDSARESYPCDGWPMGTVLCVSHAARVRHNEEMNERLAPHDAQLITAPEAAVAGANQPQDMRVWVGLALMAVCQSSHKVLKNGLRYRVEELGANLTLLRIGDKGEPRGEPFTLAVAEVAKSLRLTHAMCYYSTQARTIYGPMRLAQTSHRMFTLTHLIVGLGRGPCGDDIEVE